MKSYYFTSLEEFIREYGHDTGIYLLLVAEKSSFEYDDILNLKAQCYGAIFPEVIYEKQHFKSGIVVLKLDKEPVLIKNIEKPNFSEIKIEDIGSMLVFVDGLSASIDSFLFSLFELIDEDCILFGGGAGKLTLQQEKVLFSPSEILQDAALIISLPQKINVGVSHGWEFLRGHYIATSTDKNILKKIDYEPAFDVYKKVVEEDSGLKFTKDNFFDLAKSYPLGIVTMDGEVIVRDPIFTDDGDLILVGIMPENSVINILKGKKKNLLSAAEKAADVAIKGTDDLNMVIVIDCISRVLFLEDSFTQEISLIKEKVKGIPMVGVLTLGEIANNSKTYIDFYNKTCVVGALCSSTN